MERSDDPQSPVRIIEPMKPKLIGNPLVAWRDETTLQIGWGAHAVVVQDAPDELPGWLRGFDGQQPLAALMSDAQARGISVQEARLLMRALREAGLLVQDDRLRVSIHSSGLVHEPLAQALRSAGVKVTSGSDVVVLPLGQMPSLLDAPAARRLIPVWFAGPAVHVGPVLDDQAGPCPRCVDLAARDVDPRWPHLTAQASSIGLWGHPSQLVQAAAAITLMCGSQNAIGLEMILDPGTAGPCWRVWSVHASCACQQA